MPPKRTLEALAWSRPRYRGVSETWSGVARVGARGRGQLPSLCSWSVYCMGREAERQDATVVHRQTCQHRLAVLTEQHDDLYACLCRLCLDLWSGRKTFKIYRQFKMYNDPELNPEIYR